MKLSDFVTGRDIKAEMTRNLLILATLNILDHSISVLKKSSEKLRVSTRKANNRVSSYRKLLNQYRVMRASDGMNGRSLNETRYQEADREIEKLEKELSLR